MGRSRRSCGHVSTRHTGARQPARRSPDPEVFREGVAVAPVTAWDGYDTAYIEQDLRTPAAHAHGSRDSSVLTLADRLGGERLILHAMLGANVHFRHAARLDKARIAASKPFALVPLPEARHSARRRRDRKSVTERVAGFFKQALRSPIRSTCSAREADPDQSRHTEAAIRRVTRGPASARRQDRRRAGRGDGSGSGTRFLATIDPWHGHEVAVCPAEGPELFAARTVLDATLRGGHALWVADVDGDGDDEIIAGYRGPGTSVLAYDFDGTTWTRTVLDNAIAAQDLRGGDLDGDGTPDLVAIGGTTHNIVWYRPKKP
jgi:hypothetical protein